MLNFLQKIQAILIQSLEILKYKRITGKTNCIFKISKNEHELLAISYQTEGQQFQRPHVLTGYKVLS